jgi:hypothetical protein
MKLPLRRIFRTPIALALITAAGLLLALFGDGPWDLLSWLLLGIPLATIAWHIAVRPVLAMSDRKSASPREPAGRES